SEPGESLEPWLSVRTYWEQYVWKLNFEKVSLSEDDIDQCYQYLSDYLGIASVASVKKDPISFKDRTFFSLVDGTTPTKLRLIEIKEFMRLIKAMQNVRCPIDSGQNKL